ncbi:selenocysteine-specific translation elongation factor [Herbivorax sp. ANBcel31]|uniref:selenocysteine-specific translation elongation factor n=1 Tax=Herbivorax sp. ANBcel31 TaxID=3069754 RepID=UPI0027B3553F|nr:selenocysteine-specific translation elongation factor [Herbivorax sp. ANBcel31]MDQ2087901.1 selenocysteine-specific translation elongation factor [Herbivorax sp. ANBcel31]
MKHITIGTAGHIDHGKTALVKRLTGTDTDRLTEEKERGMTIELGFASFKLPSKNTVSIVDVPGHEKFIKNMVAGVTGIDFVLLAIAADEGIMPQTSEHIDILSVLQIKSGIVALTKSDLVDDEMIKVRKDEIKQALKGTSLENVEIFPVSSVTKNGIDELTNKIDELANTISKEYRQALFRLPLDRVFTMTGYGTVVTGTVFGGFVQKGDMVDLLPEGLSSKVRNIQVRNTNVEEAVAGDRCALNLAGIEKEDIKRGTVVAQKGILSKVILVDAAVQMVYGSEGLSHNQRVHLHIGTSSVLARVRLIGGDRIEPSKRGYVQLRLEEPIVALRGDRFILRSYSPVRTIGGGKILFHRTKNRKRFDEASINLLRISDEGDEKVLIESVMKVFTGFFNVDNLYYETMIDRINIKKILDDMLLEGKVRYIEDSDCYVREKFYNEALENIEREFQKLYKKYPYRYLVLREEIKTRVFPLLSAKDFTGLIKIMVREGKLKIKGNMMAMGNEKRINDILSMEKVLRVKKAFLDEEYKVHKKKQLIDKVKLNENVLDEILNFLMSVSLIKELEDGFFVSKEVLLKAYQKVRKMIESQGSVTAAGLRDALGTSRKVAIIYLEYFDSQLITKRDGNDRTAGPKFQTGDGS